MNFLETLYLDGYAPSEEDFPRTAEYQQAVKHAQQYEEQIIRQLGEQFLSDYHSAKAEQDFFELAHAYAQGAQFIINLFLSGRR